MVDDDARLTLEIRDALERGAQELDVDIRARLMRARAEALATRPAFPWWKPAGGLALAAALGAAIVLLGRPVAPLPEVRVDEVFDFEMLTSTDCLELIRDLDFYRWLEEEDPNEG